jgi:hypothetical protein
MQKICNRNTGPMFPQTGTPQAGDTNMMLPAQRNRNPADNRISLFAVRCVQHTATRKILRAATILSRKVGTNYDEI